MNHRQQYSHYFASRSAYEDALMRSYKARDDAIMKLDDEKNTLFDEYEFFKQEKERFSMNLKILLESLPESRVVWTKEQKNEYAKVRSSLNQANLNFNETNQRLIDFLNKCSDVTDIAFENAWKNELDKAKSKINQKNLE